ncbi:methyl-accepting chemotaxis protein [Roseiterribacter gracilis]|uniref:Chemotaxis protein n=1 Tax=Roseiterribacter gracilis TaxID=2812848 RepID=A0A8S8XIH6_9PROT|nr:chemotaxis protein [Rhodospirillales bacterium TMPK1]
MSLYTRLRNLRVQTKLTLLSVLVAVSLAVVGFIALQMNRAQMVEDRIFALHAIVDTTKTLAASYEAEIKAGKISKEDAIKAWGKTLSSMKYGPENDYVLAYYMDGLSIAHGNPAFIGTNRLDVATNGQYITRMLRDAVANSPTGEAMVPYDYPRTPGAPLQPKLTYVAAFKPWNVFIGTGVYIDDIDVLYRTFALRLGAIVLLTAIVGAVAAQLVGRSITKPLAGLENAMTDLAQGNLRVEVVGLGRADEIGAMASAVDVFKQQAQENDRLRQDQKASEERAAEERRQARRELGSGFEARVGSIVQGVSSAATQMEATAGSMSSVADNANSQAGAAASAIDQTTNNVQMVAAATEQLAASAQEIGRQVETCSSIASKAVLTVQNTDETVRGLAESAQKIGEVVRLIQDIAGQTNLLALNATIEAARAGDAGKGFAVVANEVKALAGQTARATEEISGQIAAIQHATTGTVDAIRDIGQVIGEIDQVTTAIAAAVEEQGAATRNIAGNVSSAAAGAQDAASTLGALSQSSSEVGGAATQVLSAARMLAKESERLRSEVGGFIASVQAG